MKKLLLICLIAMVSNVNCQSTTATTDTKSNWDKIAWITGDWVGDGFGGVSYESWTEPIAGIILCTYRHVSEGKNNFFELITVSEKEDGDLVMKLRHFNPDMNAWEDKEGQLVWEMTNITDSSVTFGPCTYTLVAPDKMEIYLVMNNDGKIETEVFHFDRKKG